MASRQKTIETAQSYFDAGFACSQSILLCYADQFGLDENTAKLISSGFGGGMGRLREKCGALTGSFMVIGLKYGNTDPKDLETKLNAYQKIQELNKQFIKQWYSGNCEDILNKFTSPEEVDKRIHHQIICRKLVGQTAGMLFDILNSEKL